MRFPGSFAGREDNMADKKKAPEGGAANEAPAKEKRSKKAAASEAAAEPAPPPPAPAPAAKAKSMKIPKLAKKNKSRLPRRQKKALMKGQAGRDEG